MQKRSHLNNTTTNTIISFHLAGLPFQLLHAEQRRTLGIIGGFCKLKAPSPSHSTYNAHTLIETTTVLINVTNIQ